MSISLRYSLELAANGMQHGYHLSLGKLQRLDMLGAHETAWRSLSWSNSSPMDARTKPDASHEQLLVLRAPSKLRDVTMKNWILELPHDAQDICIDSAQDLLVFRCGTKSFHVCSLSTGKTHPLVDHVGVINAVNSWKYRPGSMRICGDYFAVASEQGLYISAWNWKSGEHKSDFMASLQSSVFHFLDEHRILFPSSIDDSLYMYDILSMPPINTRQRKLKGTHCFEISLPQFCRDQVVYNIDLRCNSVVTGIDATAPFNADSHGRMMALQISVGPNLTDSRSDSGQVQCEMHVSASALLAWTEKHPAPPNACVIVPWSAWGSAAARIIAPRIDDTLLCASQSKFLGSGMRVVSPPSIRSDGASIITVTDYHPARVFRGQKQSQTGGHQTPPTRASFQFDETWPGGNAKRRSSQPQSVVPPENGAYYSRLRSKSLPLPIFSSTASVRAMSATEMIKSILTLGWYGPAEPRKSNAGTRPGTARKKLEYLEKDISLPKELHLSDSQPVFNVLCEDAIMFYTLVPRRNAIHSAHWYTF
ncbi:hypothetical protein B0F90DRAFT_1823909 [Multifurca ochricompacta]|uniref:Uncharacterized protein n=1 Tax=Multifurca ochricompacta TaxID=376703 RepID=A0AAD4LVU1_9AGAM|nr:hypothetical protein B0F90DRAFT_1823909 [Multifurca ochricompacta]